MTGRFIVRLGDIDRILRNTE